MSLKAIAKNPIAILATPKTGNLWIKHVLVNVLEMTSDQFFNDQEIIRYFNNAQSIRQIVFHAHLPYTSTLHDILITNKIKMISLMRNPLDIFLSLRSHVSRLGPASAQQGLILSEEPELIRDFARTYFLGDLGISAMWARRDAIFLRYENLITDPLNGFAEMGRKLGIAHPEIEQFAISCTRMSDIQEMRANARPGEQGHFTSAEIDKWKRPENREIVSILLQCPPIRSALRLWGYSDCSDTFG